MLILLLKSAVFYEEENFLQKNFTIEKFDQKTIITEKGDIFIR